MPKVKISEYSATANSNTDVASINIDEGCAPSGINNAIRAIMGHLKDFQSGTSNDPFTVGSSGSLTLSYGTANGVAYLNGSKVLTAGSALTFDGTKLGVGAAATEKLQSNAGIAATGANLSVGSLDGFVADYSSGVSRLFASRNGVATGTMAFWTTDSSGTAGERMRLDSSGNLGIANTSMGQKLAVNGGIQTNGSAALGVGFGGGAVLSFESPVTRMYFGDGTGYSLVFSKRGSSTTTDLMTLTDSGNLGIGTTSPATKLHISTDGTYDPLRLQSTQSGYARSWTIGPNVGANGLFVIRDSTAGENRLAIDSSGNLLVGASITSSINGTFCPIQGQNNTANQVAYFRNTNANPYGIIVNYSAASPNNTGNEFIYCSDSTAQRFSARSNGGLANYSANNVNLSDRREKTNFAPAKSYLDVICAIPVQTFNYIDQNLEEDDGLTLGVVAQDVQAVAPELVMESNWGTKEEPKMRLSIYQTDLQYALMKCIQEQQAIIQSLTARITALEGA